MRMREIRLKIVTYFFNELFKWIFQKSFFPRRDIDEIFIDLKVSRVSQYIYIYIRKHRGLLFHVKVT